MTRFDLVMGMLYAKDSVVCDEVEEMLLFNENRNALARNQNRNGEAKTGVNKGQGFCGVAVSSSGVNKDQGFCGVAVSCSGVNKDQGLCGAVIQSSNGGTQKYKPETPMAVTITVFKDNTFEFTVKSSSVTWYLKKAAGIESESGSTGQVTASTVSVRSRK
ncbi:hypothetical protein ACLB2K_015121 [Fragaria x ananassa]